MTETNTLTGIHCVSLQRVQLERVSGFVWLPTKTCLQGEISFESLCSLHAGLVYLVH